MNKLVFSFLAALPCILSASTLARPLSVFNFMTVTQIAQVQNGTSTDDTHQVQAALNALQAGSPGSLYFPAGTYKVKTTLFTSGVLSCRIFGETGFDGAESVMNGGTKTIIKWIGPSDPSSPVVRHTRANGMVWSGISIDCNHLAGYGIQFDSDLQTAGAVRNVIELCSVNYAQRDGILIGSEGSPSANPGDRQFFAYTVRQVVVRGCQRSGIHVNEWNADAHVYDQVWGFPDDTKTWNCANVFWFERGGNASELRSCESSATVASAIEGSGFMIKNGSSEKNTGCQGLSVINAWSEDPGGFFWANTIGDIKNPYTFINCKAYGYGTGTKGLSVYVTLKGGKPASFTFMGCHFNSNVKFDTPNITSSFFADIGNYWGPTAGVIDCRGAKTIKRFANLGNVNTVGKALVPPRFANVIMMTLAANLPAIYMEGMDDVSTPVTLIVKQDALGDRTIVFGADQWADASSIPQPAPTANAVTIYVFTSDGNYWHLVSVRSNQ
ncbi:MAG: hypothetical protein KJ964_10560 [Verrucomicrobia bacterium]|nr:hypothetical protein [Verrucomicrobiota bacterium]MBU1735527.1 hypothetical protein [Verrucomicrobiota bacterium]MBU1857994.1 hypothetical protein [Verrucomicrobiota bacterium]